MIMMVHTSDAMEVYIRISSEGEASHGPCQRPPISPNSRKSADCAQHLHS